MAIPHRDRVSLNRPFYRYGGHIELIGCKGYYGIQKKKMEREKKIVVPCLSLFARKAPVKTDRVLAGHPIILLKSIKFNMAAVSVKMSIGPHSF